METNPLPKGPVIKFSLTTTMSWPENEELKGRPGRLQFWRTLKHPHDRVALAKVHPSPTNSHKVLPPDRQFESEMSAK